MKAFSCAVVGATGMVGRKMIEILEERKLPVSQLFLFASARSAGKKIPFNGCDVEVEELTPAAFSRGIDFALFAVSNAISREYAPTAARAGCTVVDNSSAWRMDSTVPLVVPEVNGDDLASHAGIIANPNCCAAPAVVALKPLRDAPGIKRVVISTYQSVSGAGVGGWEDLTRTLAGEAPAHFPYPIAHNLIPHIGDFESDGYTGEEKKLIAEIRKMLHLPALPVTATTVRVPVYTGHSLSMNIELKTPFSIEEIRTLYATAPAVSLTDTQQNYPMPITAAGNDLVHIGRIRRDTSVENGINLWLSCDNTRKGAAGNAVQVLEKIIFC
ncbi:MAG: aspartate-semialdehyde dehydrogenase [Defluviitaleaceae bacterium]|nr:aspartate-semialdehyde dehydrogenase [Defluviitaleaceae bacterium]MCL2274292.1 aspartate-semialdehyde dehydrogenase [Defluviitaleaceae bacterium]